MMIKRKLVVIRGEAVKSFKKGQNRDTLRDKPGWEDVLSVPRILENEVLPGVTLDVL